MGDSPETRFADKLQIGEVWLWIKQQSSSQWYPRGVDTKNKNNGKPEFWSNINISHVNNNLKLVYQAVYKVVL